MMTAKPEAEKHPEPQKQRMATAFAVPLMASGASEEEAARAMFRGNIRAQDVANAAAWLVRVAVAMKAHEEKKPVA